MSSLMDRFVSRTRFESYEDFSDNFKIIVPESFNFAFDVVDVYAKEHPDKVALVWCNDFGDERTFSFKDMKYLSDKAANFFLDCGIGKGDAVMLIMRSRFDFWITLIALHKIGAVAIPSTHMQNKKDLIYRIKKADLKMIVCVEDGGVADRVDLALAEIGDVPLHKVFVGPEDAKRVGWRNLRKELLDSSHEFEKPSDLENSRNEDVLLAYFTPGTTGDPKMVIHDHTYPLGHIVTAKYWQNVVEDGLHLAIADTGWSKAVWGMIYGQWIAGSAIFAYDYDLFDPEKMMEKIAKYQVTTFCAPLGIINQMIKADITKYDLSTLKYAATSGDSVNPAVYDSFLEKTGLQLMEGFGQTETGAVIANFPWMKPKPGSMGKPSPGYDVVLAGNEGEICGMGEEGVIVIRTDGSRPLGLFAGYYLEPEMTAGVFHDGNYHTGDIAWMDEDGYFWFVGRADDIIKTSGYRVRPTEVESALMSHQSVLECAVTGIPDPEKGQIVKASVVLEEGFSPSEELELELQNYVKGKAAPYKYPRVVEFVEEIPKTISGKIKRFEIRATDKPHPVINAIECKACERCILACPVNVLELSHEFNERGYRFIIYEGEGCTGCGGCYYTCPEPMAIEVHIPTKATVEEV